MPAGLALGAVGSCVLLALVDPNEGGRYPTCPTRALLGLDCPACGTLRGVHALTRGRIGTALDHNLLLAIAVPVGFFVWWSWIRAALGRPARHRPVPRWAAPAAVALALVFTLIRNIAGGPWGWLDSNA